MKNQYLLWHICMLKKDSKLFFFNLEQAKKGSLCIIGEINQLHSEFIKTFV